MTVRSSNVKNGSTPRHAAPGSANQVARDIPVSAEDFERMIAIEAYFRAERRGFAPGHELADWCKAEADVKRQLGRRFEQT